jgi:hypothetical protein
MAQMRHQDELRPPATAHRLACPRLIVRSLEPRAVPISRIAQAGIKRGGEGSSEVKVSYAARGDGRGHREEMVMWPTWKTFPTRWNHVMRVVLVLVVLFVSACTMTGRSSSNPATLPPDGGYAGPRDSGSGNGGGGY